MTQEDPSLVGDAPKRMSSIDFSYQFNSARDHKRLRR